MESELKTLPVEWPQIEAEVRKHKNTTKALGKILGEAFSGGRRGK